MLIRTLLFLFLLSLNLTISAKEVHKGMINYPLKDDPIDVVIVSHEKDKPTLGLCIDGIRENCNNVRRVIVVSSEKLTDKAEWFNEKRFPFNKEEIRLKIARGDEEVAKKFFYGEHRTPGWYFQQMLKLYSPLIIPKISSNVLIIDADTIFMNPVKFLNDSFGGLFCYNTRDQVKLPYIQHAERLVPGYKRIHPEIYSVCHHMLLQRPILEDLFRTVEEYHKTDFWKAFCHCVDLKRNKGGSEYEIYYNYALTHTDQVELRKLKWANSSRFSQRNDFKKKHYHFVSFHDYMREKPMLGKLREGGIP